MPRRTYRSAPKRQTMWLERYVSSSSVQINGPEGTPASISILGGDIVQEARATLTRVRGVLRVLTTNPDLDSNGSNYMLWMGVFPTATTTQFPPYVGLAGSGPSGWRDWFWFNEAPTATAPAVAANGLVSWHHVDCKAQRILEAGSNIVLNACQTTSGAVTGTIVVTGYLRFLFKLT